MILDAAIISKAIIAVISPIVAAAIKIIYKPRKRISCVIFLDKNLKNTELETESKQCITLEFHNSGSKSLTKKDFHKPVVLDFKNGSKIISYQIYDKNPSNVEVYTRKEINKILILPDLMNKNESFKLNITLKRFEENSLIILHRMIDVELKVSKKSDTNFIDFIRILLSLIVFCLIMFWIYNSIGILENNSDIFKEFVIALSKSLFILPIVYFIIHIRLPRKKIEYVF
ncbi:hypothetical protein ACQKC9_04005 [Psychrobacter sp. NPDC078409]|uniref:hypothetical protein n=1 Tax=Psychrobacter sp. NPDC078409 TaxID=3390660 RepID=UPI003D072F3C